MAADFIDEAIRGILVADAGIIATGATVHINAVPQETPVPFVIIHQVSRVPSETKDGVSVTDVYRVQVDCWDKSISAARDLGAAVKSAIDGFKGIEGNVEIINTWIVDQQTVRSDELEYNGVSSDYMVIEAI